MAEPQKVYWDSCVWIALINRDPGVDCCDYVVECARRGEVAIWTSSLSLAEVYKAKAEDGNRELMASKDPAFAAFLEQDFVYEVQVDHDIAVLARALCRKYPVLKKPNDGIHMATAVTHNLDQFHTYDRDDLLRLSGQILRLDGKPLPISKPPDRPPPPPEPESKNPNLSLFPAK